MYGQNRVRYFQSPEYDLYGRRLTYRNSVQYDPQAKVTIPRPTHIFNTQVADATPTNVVVNMTPDEDAVDRVANEFRFLDERPLGSSSAETERSTGHGSRDFLNSRSNTERRTRKKFAFCLFACFLQLCIAITLFAFAGFRFRRIFERPSSFIDFDNPQWLEVSNESASIASMLSGSSLFVPALLHIIAAITAAWPILPKFSSTLQILYIIFSCFSIIFWFNGIITIAFELNIYYVQLNEFYNTFAYRTLIVVITLGSVDVLLIPTLGIVYAAYKNASPARQKRSLFHSIASLFPILFSATSLFLSALCLFYTTKTLHHWSSLNSAIFFHLLGLRELIVSTHSLVVSVIGFAITLTTSRRLRYGVAILYSVSLLVLLIYIVNGERIFSTTENFRALEATHIDSTLLPVTPVLLMSTYIFLWLLAVSYVFTIMITVHAIITSKRVRRYSASDKLPPYLEFRHRSIT